MILETTEKDEFSQRRMKETDAWYGLRADWNGVSSSGYDCSDVTGSIGWVGCRKPSCMNRSYEKISGHNHISSPGVCGCFVRNVVIVGKLYKKCAECVEKIEKKILNFVKIFGFSQWKFSTSTIMILQRLLWILFFTGSYRDFKFCEQSSEIRCFRSNFPWSFTQFSLILIK